MSITASRLGSAPITLDWSNLGRTSHASSPEIWAEEVHGAWAKLRSRFATGEIGFYDSVINNELSQLQESVALAEQS